MLFTAKELAKKYATLNYQEFADFVFQDNSSLLEWASLKDDFHKAFKEKGLKMPVLKTINAIINGTAKKEFREFDIKVQADLSKLNLKEKIEYLTLALEQVQQNRENEIKKREKKVSTYLRNTTIIDFDNELEEPWHFFTSQRLYLDKILKKREYDLKVETTPIAHRLIASLYDFEFEDWCLKVIKEEPEYKLPYYLKLQNGVALYSKREMEKEPERNYFDVRRLCTYDHESQMYFGPTNSFNDFNNWLKNQVNLYSQEKPQIKEAMFFGNVKKMKFTEPILKSKNDETVNELDVTYNPNGRCEELKTKGVLCDKCMTDFVADKIPELQFAQRKKWVDYQTDLRKDKLLFLDELQGLLRDNHKYFNDGDFTLVSNFETHIESKRTEIKNANTTNTTEQPRKSLFSINDILNKSSNNNLPKVQWNGSDTDLLELIVALTQSRKLVNEKGDPVRKDIMEFFEKAFNIEIKDPEKKISTAKGRKRSPTPFLNSLVQAYEEWKKKKNEK